jgi:hypothetical protein
MPVTFVLFGTVLGAGLIALCGWEATTWQVYDVMVLAGAVAGAVTNLFTMILKQKSSTPTGSEDRLSILPG